MEIDFITHCHVVIYEVNIIIMLAMERHAAKAAAAAAEIATVKALIDGTEGE
jgi:hypothetical protein